MMSRNAYATLLQLSTLLLLSARGCILYAQAKPFAPDKMETILYGVAFYPEYMPYERLDKDVDLMQKAGISVVRGRIHLEQLGATRWRFSICLDAARA